MEVKDLYFLLGDLRQENGSFPRFNVRYKTGELGHDEIVKASGHINIDTNEKYLLLE